MARPKIEVYRGTELIGVYGSRAEAGKSVGVAIRTVGVYFLNEKFLNKDDVWMRYYSLESNTVEEDYQYRLKMRAERRIKKVCRHCGKPFEVTVDHATQLYCSTECKIDVRLKMKAEIRKREREEAKVIAKEIKKKENISEMAKKQKEVGHSYGKIMAQEQLQNSTTWRKHKLVGGKWVEI